MAGEAGPAEVSPSALRRLPESRWFRSLFQPKRAELRRSLVETGLVAAALFAVYAAGACRTIYVGDSGELVTVAATLGIPHPSGYPLYVLAGWIWTRLLGFLSPAFALSLFSGLCAAVAAAGLHLVVRRSTGERWAGLLAAGILAFSPSFWSQANVQRVYALNALFVVAVLGLAREWLETRRDGWMVAAAFAAGLGASNHTVMALVGLAVGLSAVAVDPGWLRRPRSVAACVGAGVAGLLPYLYLPLRSRFDPRLDWGDPETLDRFLSAVLRHDFWERRFYEGPADLGPIAGDWLAGIGVELFGVGAVLAVVGLVVAPRFGWPRSLPLLVMLVNLGAMALHGSRSDLFIWHRYYIPTYVVAALLAGLGTAALVPRLKRLAPAVLVVPLVMLVVGWPRFDRHDYRIAEDFSRTLLSTLPPGAHLAASDDNILFVLMYLHIAEGVRPDVDLILQGVGGATLADLRFDPDTDPLFFTHDPNWRHPELRVVPVGLVFRTVRTGTVPPPARIPKWELEGEGDPGVPKDYLTRNLIGQFHFMLGMTLEGADWPRAVTEWGRAAEVASRNDVLFYNLGLIYRRNGLPGRALAAFERSAEINPRHIASNRPVRPVDRVRELREEVARAEEIEAAVAAAARVGADPVTAAGHRRLAAALAGAGEELLARGHRLVAAEMEAGVAPAGSEMGPVSEPSS